MEKLGREILACLLDLCLCLSPFLFLFPLSDQFRWEDIKKPSYGHSLCYGLNCVSPHLNVGILTPGVNFFGHRAFKEVTKVK